MKIVLLSQLLILAGLIGPGLMNAAHASATGVVCLAAGGSTTCPLAPPVIRSTAGAVQLRVAVVISNSSSFNTLDITLLTNHTILKPAGVSLSGSVLPSPTTLIQCVGLVAQTSQCASTDNVDTLHFSASGGFTNQPTTGLLFTAIFNITGPSAPSGSPIAFQTGCTNTSAGTTCVNIGQGALTPVPETTQSALFSSTRGFALSANPSILTLFSGQTGTSRITVTSLSGFTGTVSLTLIHVSTGPAVQLNLTSLIIPVNGSNSTILRATNTGVAPGTYLVTVRGTSGTITATTPVNIIVTAGSFQLSASPGFLPVVQGSSASSVLTATSVGGFTGTISLTALVSPLGPTAFLNLTSLKISANGQNSTLLQISAGNTVPVGNYNVTVTGFSGGLQASALLSVSVVSSISGGDFTFIPSSTSISIGDGATGNITMTATSVGGFTGQIMISQTNLTGLPPAGTSEEFFSIISLTSGGTGVSFLFITVPYTATATSFAITMTGTSGSLSHSFILHVTVFAQPAFIISARDFTLLVGTGFSNSTIVHVNANSLFSGTVTLSTTIAPQGLTAAYSSNSLTLHPNQQSNVTLTISAAASTPPGFYFLNALGQSGQMIQKAFINILVEAVQPPPTPNFTLTAFPRSAAVQPGNFTAFTITLRSLNGLSGTVNLTTTVTPSGLNSPAAILPAMVTLPANGTVNLTMLVTTSTNTPFGAWSISASGVAGTVHSSDSVFLQVVPPPDEPPVARFTFSPSPAVVGASVTFDGSASFDPDGSIQGWTWEFGDGGILSESVPIAFHTYFNPGTYTVRLTVTDSSIHVGSTNMTIVVLPKPLNDVSITNINAFPQKAVATQLVSISLTIENNGVSNETVSITAYANGQPVATLNDIFVCSSNPNPFHFCYPFTFETLTWDTTGALPGNYTISATVSLPTGETDPTPSDNTAFDGTVTVLPAPVVTVTPSSGPVGTKVLVTGSGFPATSPFSSVNFIVVTFDDVQLGFMQTRGGSFNLTIDVPQAQAGAHLVKAFDEFTLARGVASFTVTPPSGSLAVSIDTGSIYFPGDSAVVYVLTTFNGAPVGPSGLQLRVTVFKPDGTNITLVTTPVSKGLFKATFTISSTGPLGTYGIFASAHETGPLDSSALRSFEVKPTWLSQNGRAMIGAATVTGLVGLVALAWKQGYLQRRKGDPTIPSF